MFKIKNREAKSEGVKSSIAYSYALGDFCFTFFIMFIGYYLMYFLTDIIALPAALAATLYTLVQVFETMGVIIGGIVIDRVRLRGGKYRPWLLIGGSICGLFTFLFFFKFDISIPVYTYLFPLLYLIAYWGYNFMWVAFRSLPGKISRNQNDVMTLAISSQQAAVAASLIFSAVGVKLLYGFSDVAAGYRASTALYGAVMIACMIMVFKVTKPFDSDASAEQEFARSRKVTLSETLKCITGPMLPFFLSNVLRSSVSVAIPALMVYYFNYVLSYTGGMTLYLSVISVLQIAAVLLLKPLAKRFSKIFIYRLTGAVSCAATLCAYFFGTNILSFVILMAVNNFSLVLASGITYAFITDIADYNEYKKGLYTRGFTVSLSGTSNTLASLIGGAIASFSLALIGYDAGLAVQSAHIAQNIRAIVTLGSSLMSLVGLIPFMFYKLNDKAMREVYELKTSAQANPDSQRSSQ